MDESSLPGPLVDAAWLADHLDEVVVADVRWYLDGRSGRGAYDSGHIPGAVFVDLDRDLASPPAAVAGRHPLPSPADFAAAMSRLGIDDGSPVVAYDDAGGSIAARLWWMLDSLGHPVAVLDGGVDAWPGPRSTVPVAPRPATFTVRSWPADRFAAALEVDRLRLDPTALVLDARAAPRFTGEDTSIDPRPGHVPGARNAPWSENVVDGRLADPEVLRRRFVELGAESADEIVAYCGSGVTACHDLLALRVAGYSGRLFVASWSGWSTDPSRPAACE